MRTPGMRIHHTSRLRYNVGNSLIVRKLKKKEKKSKIISQKITYFTFRFTKGNEIEILKSNRKQKKEKWIERHEEEEEKVLFTVREEINGYLGSLVHKFMEEMNRFKTNSYNINNKLNLYRQLKRNMKSNGALLHVDFFEYNECKLGRESQSMHFSFVRKNK